MVYPNKNAIGILQVGTVVANVCNEDYNPYVLTKDGWIEVGLDSSKMTYEGVVLFWLTDPEWQIIYRGNEW